jgi:hypothetical protein
MTVKFDFGFSPSHIGNNSPFLEGWELLPQASVQERRTLLYRQWSEIAGR